MMGAPPMGPMTGFGPQMYQFPEVRPAPHASRPEKQALPEDKRVVKEHPVHLPDGSTLATGSDKFALYGALEDIARQDMEEQDEYLKRRRRINCVPALNALFLPWVLFLIVYSVASFYIHYTMPGLVFVVNTTIVVCTVSYAYQTSKASGRMGAQRAFYPTYMSIMLTVAVTFGWLLGDLNFWFNMEPAYNIEHLATYNNVNPSKHTGKRYQDAGEVYFQANSVIDFSRAMSFKMGDLYCVAPIVDPSCKKNCIVDMWAVGINCCAEDVADFRCGEYNNPAAKSGLRLMHDEQRPNFRLAVLQAEGVHKMVSTHPLFFYWLHDPLKEIDHIKRKGFKGFVLLMIVSFFGFALMAYLSLKRAREKFGPQ